MEKTLREMGERGDIVKTVHQALTKRGHERAATDYANHRGADERRTMS